MSGKDNNMSPYNLVYYDQIESKDVKWLWYPYIPYGKITIVQGDPGEGKSTLMLQVASLLTQGKNMPGEDQAVEPANVIYQAIEDGLEDTIKPRLEAAGADCQRIAFLDDEDSKLTLDDGRLEQAILDTNTKLLVIDPFQAYLGNDSDIQRMGSMRSVIGSLSKVAENTGCAIVLIGHLNKSSRAKGIYRGLGSIDIAAIARNILMIITDRDNPDYRIMVPIKNNLAPIGKPFAFELNSKTGFRWIGIVEDSAEVLLSGEKAIETKLLKAKEYLKLLLNGTDLYGKEVYTKLSSQGIGRRTIEQAKKELKISSYKSEGKWYWHLEE